MSGLSREILEGVISLAAVAVLVYVGFWLHRHSEARKWQAYLQGHLERGLSTGSHMLLAAVAFMAVFREAIEVVLFLRAIWIDLEPSGQKIAGLGVLSSFGLLVVLAYFSVNQSRKLPVEILFRVCSWMMIALALMLAGKGAHSLQEAGALPVTSLSFVPRLDLLGIYPSVETIAAQAIVAALFGALFFTSRSENCT
jgi:high-affinity iron transporter